MPAPTIGHSLGKSFHAREPRASRSALPQASGQSGAGGHGEARYPVCVESSPCKVCITGATGFIGRYFLHAMLADGHEVRVLARPGRESAVDIPAGLEDRVEIHTGDLTDSTSIHGFLAGARYLIHLASAHDHFSHEVMQQVNVQGTEALIADAKKNATKDFQFIIISSAVIGVPVYSYYRDSKRVQEKIVRGSGLPWASFRPTLVYGVGDYRHTAPFLRKCGEQKGTYWVFHEGLSKINPVHVDDLIDVVRRFFQYDRALDVDCIYEIAGPEGIAFNDFIDVTRAATGGKVKRRNIPRRWVERAILLKGIFKDVTKERRGAGYFSLHHDHNITAAREELGWDPRTYPEGLKEITQTDWWRSEGPPAVS
ncbi:MAG: nucleoside-diphosphate-sugar epimerase [Chlamydiales bacterium]|jgi:nucleoside-diphosphate-sugar epimerase